MHFPAQEFSEMADILRDQESIVRRITHVISPVRMISTTVASSHHKQTAIQDQILQSVLKLSGVKHRLN
ncbi:hypothetical protein XH97_30445 [Bradyrhizobium sp. CCBAU 53380]|nr:hypothetical protein [Bradyrhizobium sp. CCBAU 53380]